MADGTKDPLGILGEQPKAAKTKVADPLGILKKKDGGGESDLEVQSTLPKGSYYQIPQREQAVADVTKVKPLVDITGGYGAISQEEVKKKYEAEKEKDIQVGKQAVENTTRNFFKSRKLNIKSDDPSYNITKKKIAQEFYSGNLKVIRDDLGNPVLARKKSGLEAFLGGLTEWWEGEKEAKNTGKMTDEELKQHYNKRREERVSRDYTVTSGLGAELLDVVGQQAVPILATLGGGVLGKVAEGAILPTAVGRGIGSGGVGFGAAVGSGVTAAYLASQQTESREREARYNQYIDEQIAKGRTDTDNIENEALEKAREQGRDAGLIAALTSIPLSIPSQRIVSGTSFQTGKQGLLRILLNHSKDLVKRDIPLQSGSLAAGGVLTEMAAEAKGYKNIDKLGAAIHGGLDGIVFALGFKALEGGLGLAKAGLSYSKELFRDVPKTELTEMVKQAEKEGIIQEGSGEKIIKDIDEYNAVRNKVPDDIEGAPSYAGLILKRKKLEEKQSIYDEEIFPQKFREYQDQIDAVNKQLKDFGKTKDPLSKEVDDITGEEIGLPVDVVEETATPPKESAISVLKPEEVSKPNVVEPVKKEEASIGLRRRDVEVAKTNLAKRVSGDKLLDAQDLIDELNDNKAEIDNDGMVTVYHRTTPENKAEIEKTGKMKGFEDGVFFSTKETGQNEGYGDAIVKLKIPVEKLELDDTFGDEAHIRIPTKKAGQIVDVKEYLPKDQSLSPTTEPIKVTEEGVGQNVPTPEGRQSEIISTQKEIAGGEGTGNVPPIEPLKEQKIAVEGVDGKRELDKLANNIPDSGKVAEYMSKETIEKYTGETPINEQKRGVQELNIALEHGEKIIEKAKELYGDDYVEKTLDYIDNSTAGVSNKALMYVSLENALGREKLLNPEKAADLTKQQALVYEKSQAFARENSLALNYQKLRKIAKVGYDIEKVTDNFFSPEELLAKKQISKAVEADADTINKEAEILEKGGITPEIEKLVQEGVEKEVVKLYEALPKTKRETVDKTIKALERVQQKLRSKTYESTLGVPVAVIDAGITVIKNAIKAGANIADAIELGIKKIKEKYGKEWNKEDEFRKDVLDAFKEEQVKFKKSTKDIVKEALIEKGFGREINVKGEKKIILDWKKLAGAAGTISQIRENVNQVLMEKGLRGLSDTEKGIIKEDFIKEYVDLRTSVIEKAQNELARRNKENITPEQKSAAQKLSELYTYGLFEQKADEFETALNKALGAKVSEEGLKEANQIAKSLETIYSQSFKGIKLNDISAKAAIEKLEDRMRVLLFREARKQGNFNLKAANIVSNYLEIQQTAILNNFKQLIENPLSGLQQNLIDKLFVNFTKTSTPELANQRRKMMKDIYKDMVLSGGIGYGKVENQFVNRQNVDDYVNKLSDSKLYHGIASVLTGKAILNSVDAMFKAAITEKKFVYNLIKILTHETNPNKIPKQDALKFVSERLTGQTFKDAQKTAIKIIDKINEDAGKELLPKNKEAIDRFANDIVKASLEMGNKITTEQVTAAYNAAYKAAGLGLGHEANNLLSSSIKGYGAKLEVDKNRAIQNKEWNRAAMLKMKSSLFRNILNPFVGGGTNWLVLKLEKTGLGLFTGAMYHIGAKSKIDLSTEIGLKRLEERLYNHARYKDNYMRGLVGGIASLLTYGAFLGLANLDEYREWRGNNPWAARYLDTIAPEYLLAHMAVKDEKTDRYLSSSFNRGDAFSAENKLAKGLKFASEGEKGKAWGALGEAIGSKLNAPLPWRLVRDVQVLYQGVKGEDPYHGNYKPSNGFMSGVMQGGVLEYLGVRPLPKEEKEDGKQKPEKKPKPIKQ